MTLTLADPHRMTRFLAKQRRHEYPLLCKEQQRRRKKMQRSVQAHKDTVLVKSHDLNIYGDADDADDDDYDCSDYDCSDDESIYPSMAPCYPKELIVALFPSELLCATDACLRRKRGLLPPRGGCRGGRGGRLPPPRVFNFPLLSKRTSCAMWVKAGVCLWVDDTMTFSLDALDCPVTCEDDAGCNSGMWYSKYNPFTGWTLYGQLSTDYYAWCQHVIAYHPLARSNEICFSAKFSAKINKQHLFKCIKSSRADCGGYVELCNNQLSGTSLAVIEKFLKDHRDDLERFDAGDI